MMLNSYLNVRLEVVSHRIYFLELVPVLLKPLLRLRLEVLLRGEVVRYHFFHAPSVLQFLLQAVVVLGQEAEGMINLMNNRAITDRVAVYIVSAIMNVSLKLQNPPHS